MADEWDPESGKRIVHARQISFTVGDADTWQPPPWHPENRDGPDSDGPGPDVAGPVLPRTPGGDGAVEDSRHLDEG